VVTGWFSEFTDLSEAPSGRVEYGPGPARFAGATYDFTSHYRGAAVLRFFEEENLTAERLRELSQHQGGILAKGHGLGSVDAVAGFLAIPTTEAPLLAQRLKQQNIWTDYRGNMLRLGPAPYVTDAQLAEAADVLAASLRKPL
jgi:hypothetical protein